MEDMEKVQLSGIVASCYEFDKISSKQMTEDAIQILEKFASDYERMAQ